jgi:hypothetical protein
MTNPKARQQHSDTSASGARNLQTTPACTPPITRIHPIHEISFDETRQIATYEVKDLLEQRLQAYPTSLRTPAEKLANKLRPLALALADEQKKLRLLKDENYIVKSTKVNIQLGIPKLMKEKKDITDPLVSELETATKKFQKDCRAVFLKFREAYVKELQTQLLDNLLLGIWNLCELDIVERKLFEREQRLAANQDTDGTQTDEGVNNNRRIAALAVCCALKSLRKEIKHYTGVDEDTQNERFVELSKSDILLSTDGKSELFEGQKAVDVYGIYYINKSNLTGLYSASLFSKAIDHTDALMAGKAGYAHATHIPGITFEVHWLEQSKAIVAKTKAASKGHEQGEQTKQVTFLVDKALASTNSPGSTSHTQDDHNTAKSTKAIRKASKKSKGRGTQVPASSTPNSTDADKNGNKSPNKMKPKQRNKAKTSPTTKNNPNRQDTQHHGTASNKSNKSARKWKRKQRQQQIQDGKGAKKQKRGT